jgi:hypothetical protein
MDLRQTEEYARYMSLRGWTVERVGGNAVFVRKMPVVPFSVLKMQRFDKEFDEVELVEVKKRYGVFYSILEPEIGVSLDFCKNLGYGVSRSPYLPSASIRILIDQKGGWRDDYDKETRRLIKKNAAASKVVKVSNGDSKSLWRFWSAWGETLRGYRPGWDDFCLLLDAFGDRARVVVVREDEEDVAGAVVLYSDDTAYYFFAWTNGRGREMAAQYVLVDNEIGMAAKNGLSFWDFEGVEDSRFPRKSWRGFSRFKAGFGGEVVEYPGCFSRFL